MEKKSNHQVNIVRIDDIRPHTNADNLELIIVRGYQVVVRKGEYKLGDLAVYIQPDSVVPQTIPFKFIWGQYQCDVPPDGWYCTREPKHDGPCAAVDTVIITPEKRRRITVRRFRKEYSEGLLMPIRDLPECYPFDEGDDVSDILNIYHYEPPEEPIVKGVNMRGPTGPRKWPKSFKGWVYFLLHKIGINLNGDVQGWDRESGPYRVPFYDVEPYKNHINVLEENEEVTICEKIHGSNARFVFSNGKFYVGSRTLWKAEESTCIWRKAAKANPWMEIWCRQHENYVVYSEVTPTQRGFNYGSDEPQIFVFDVLSPDGEWLDYEKLQLLWDE